MRIVAAVLSAMKVITNFFKTLGAICQTFAAAGSLISEGLEMIASPSLSITSGYS